MAYKSPASSATKNQVGCQGRGHVLGTRIAQCMQVDTFEKSLARPEQNRRDRDMHFIDLALTKVLLDDIDAASNANIHALGGFAGLP